MDEFKVYLKENRNRLDTEEFPEDEGWASIRGKIPLQKSKVKLFHWGIAASFLILISVCFFAIYQSNYRDNTIISESEKSHNRKGSSVIPDSLKILPDTTNDIAGINVLTVPKSKKPNRISGVIVKKAKQLPTELEQMDMSFQSVINAQLKSIRTTPFYAESPDYFSFFKKEYTILEKDESTLKMELKQYGMNENFLDKLINIYQGKLSLLKKLQTEIQQMNNRIRQSDPDVANRKPVYINI